MDLFEYQGKKFFSAYGIPTSEGDVTENVEEAVSIARRVGFPAVVKAQVQVGGRGKAGGIRLVGTEDEAREAASAILGMDIKGHLVRRVWIEHASDIAKEYYVSVTLDRGAKDHLIMVSSQGGVEIEEVAASNPDAIKRLHVNPIDGLKEAEAKKIVVEAAIDEAAQAGVVDVLLKLYRAYVEGDADLVEINPLILTTSGKVHALDAKVTLDDNAAFRHPEWDEFRATQELDGREKLAKEKHLNYIGLEGSVGIIANGAGLAMSTLDVVNQVGGKAANFLDLGGGAGADVMAAALEVINTDENVRSVLINVFGGITRCDQVAKGIVDALSRVDIKSPLVVRLDGTNAQEGRKILEDFKSEKVVVEATMIGAARRAVELAGKE
ncbi:succinyl-CoA synthetase beta subunit [Ferrithrix thermotolerans DSM 19514]|uniref:Succinate--CoA ligase [ADP-forming] subunit beta n=1 Tax=Ferrithrix thermotolerans DSM 19514 TaxID=1121881 RepID=A0A1M4SWD0_9ACTN|nr:ADP-forming succinate--CoA ligase subunit beta [Ferrithrix thermotolerans]SHE36493.1 succinyl-CoA synthetase beta subunit [Ferrithrix thermotolerans DSM 19514]